MAKVLMIAKIDRPASRQALLNAGYTIRGWASARNINDGTLKQFFYGHFPRANQRGGECVKTIVAELKKSSFLRLKPEYSKAA